MKCKGWGWLLGKLTLEDQFQDIPETMYNKQDSLKCLALKMRKKNIQGSLKSLLVLL